MDEKLTSVLAKTLDSKNYLLDAKTNSHQYLNGFLDVYNIYLNNFSKELNSWLTNKMMLNSNSFNEKQFIQFACEASIVKFFAEKFPSNLFIEKQINPENKMDVDLVFTEKNYTFNIEIKCSDFIAKENTDSQNTLKIQPIGRFEDFPEQLKALQDLLKPVAERMNLDGIQSGKVMDNNLKDFLLSANKKFNPEASSSELNILSVSCDDAEDMQLWYYYMYKDQGLFKDDSFWKHSDYENVDLVLLNNLYFKHNKYSTKKLNNSWSFENSFNLIFINPFAKQKKEKAIQEFLKICPNYNNQLLDWKMPGTVDEAVKDSRKIANFIKAELEQNKGIFLFEQP